MLQNLITKMLEWIPGCSPNVPQTWQQAALQAVTCFIRWVTFALSVYLVYRLVL